MSRRRHVMSEQQFVTSEQTSFPVCSAAHTQSASTAYSISSAGILIWWLAGTGTGTGTGG